MNEILALAADNLLSPIILSFALGLGAALARSDLSVPEAAAKAMSIYLLFAIGVKGGVSVSEHGLGPDLIAAIGAGIVLSFGLPFVAFGLLSVLTGLSRIDRAAVAGHYGSISIVTFVAASTVLEGQGIFAEGYMVAVAAAMEAPAILSALWLVSRGGGRPAGNDGLMREILLNGSIVLLVGSFAIGVITGTEGLAQIDSFIVAPFQGVLCLFLLDMGLVAGRGLRQARASGLGKGAILFGMAMPLAGASLGLLAGLLCGLTPGGVALMMVLSASASYIAVPAAMRVALPEANPSVYLTLSLGVTFPFNLTLGIPLYVAVSQAMTGG
ncbi:sodium-dependent bicarbonate transport family permease [Ponticoccus sp. SC2-23]|uniref:sodium-dependent bicarbonate transport family permease n=1 Tax=Alexandriicola marinus TaxID=2081710 RepID=UPI000FDB2F56|nr:sodium-dependent bicarbonate transport family permease [Alexandriicola marinus]MBM1221862.1 sodium-dependent bicarbonate transport family permease [Ponticoccus sp. SC6-9]MBM1226213.1 sodium-dependent bicarbonate transport family permease [Ponticoccus sp. SC6-15]MBM1230809.1 sodium-dependent bicarbonate transport family permease [Ponticoccus sp. SC6-38]MBM1235350.1 sodium-dependent bicarbonate transport family permease [Ponticoccus sp. SC6-45]MBM1239831.1 sodium-dependent bicarbonate transpo